MNYLLIEDALVMTSKMMGKQVNCAVLLTEKNIFVLPYKAVGVFGVLATVQTHDFFNGRPLNEGIKKLISSLNSNEEINTEFSKLLENDKRYVYPVNEAKSIKVKGFLGKKTAMYRRSLNDYMSIGPKKKDLGIQLKEWVEANYTKN